MIIKTYYNELTDKIRKKSPYLCVWCHGRFDNDEMETAIKGDKVCCPNCGKDSIYYDVPIEYPDSIKKLLKKD